MAFWGWHASCLVSPLLALSLGAQSVSLSRSAKRILRDLGGCAATLFSPRPESGLKEGKRDPRPACWRWPGRGVLRKGAVSRRPTPLGWVDSVVKEQAMVQAERSALFRRGLFLIAAASSPTTSPPPPPSAPPSSPSGRTKGGTPPPTGPASPSTATGADFLRPFVQQNRHEPCIKKMNAAGRLIGPRLQEGHQCITPIITLPNAEPEDDQPDSGSGTGKGGRTGKEEPPPEES